MIHLLLPRRLALLIGASLLLLGRVLPLALLLPLLVTLHLTGTSISIMACSTTLVARPNACSLIGCGRGSLHLTLSWIHRTSRLTLIVLSLAHLLALTALLVLVSLLSLSTLLMPLLL